MVIVISKLGKKKQPSDFYGTKFSYCRPWNTHIYIFSWGYQGKSAFNWPFGEFACRYLYAVPEIFYGALVWFITIIAIERYSKVVTAAVLVKNGQNKIKTSLQRARAVAVFVWAMSFLILCLPIYFVVEHKEFLERR